MNTTDEIRSRQRYLASDHAAGYHAAARREECPKCQPGQLLTAEEQATLLDIVKRYYTDQASPNVAMGWVYGLVANSALNDGSL